MQEKNCLKLKKINTINQKLITIQKSYEKKIKEVTKQDDVEIINKKKKGNRKY